MKKSIYILLILFTLVSCFLLIAMGSRDRLETRQISIGEALIEVEIADNAETRRTGLMNRKSMDEDHGMLFVFEHDQKLSFWMKNTLIPLSIAYISADGEILEMYDMKPESLRPVESINSVRYALEMNHGWFERKGVCVGDYLNL
ncbi:MAG: DUF192 domain-containing protein [Spirochaetales bacterium]|nr:DUF192 domain-containing protein [Spirochaetales bacterium]